MSFVASAPSSKCVAAVDAKCPPAEKPMRPRGGIQTPLVGVHAEGADGVLHIQQRHKFSPVGQPTFEYDPCDAAMREPFGDRVALAVERKAAIASTRTDKRAGARCIRSAINADPCFRVFELSLADRGAPGPQRNTLRHLHSPATTTRSNRGFELSPPTAEQKQKKRTFDVLPNPANLIRYRQGLS